LILFLQKSAEIDIVKLDQLNVIEGKLKGKAGIFCLLINVD